jgi:ABC-type glycerol-3-phosphate transport system permease component
MFLMLRSVALTGSVWSLVVVYTFMNLPLTVWLLRGFFADLPVEIEEASFVDGASRLRSFLGITVPLALPGIIATALLAFIFAWNEFLFANILTGADTRTAPVGLTEYVTPTTVEWTNIMAAGTLVVLPVWIGALAAQRYLVRGLTMGAVK